MTDEIDAAVERIMRESIDGEVREAIRCELTLAEQRGAAAAQETIKQLQRNDDASLTRLAAVREAIELIATTEEDWFARQTLVAVLALPAWTAPPQPHPRDTAPQSGHPADQTSQPERPTVFSREPARAGGVPPQPSRATQPPIRHSSWLDQKSDAELQEVVDRWNVGFAGRREFALEALEILRRRATQQKLWTTPPSELQSGPITPEPERGGGVPCPMCGSTTCEGTHVLDTSEKVRRHYADQAQARLRDVAQRAQKLRKSFWLSDRELDQRVFVSVEAKTYAAVRDFLREIGEEK